MTESDKNGKRIFLFYVIYKYIYRYICKINKRWNIYGKSKIHGSKYFSLYEYPLYEEKKSILMHKNTFIFKRNYILFLLMEMIILYGNDYFICQVSLDILL